MDVDTFQPKSLEFPLEWVWASWVCDFPSPFHMLISPRKWVYMPTKSVLSVCNMGLTLLLFLPENITLTRRLSHNTPIQSPPFPVDSQWVPREWCQFHIPFHSFVQFTRSFYRVHLIVYDSFFFFFFFSL